MGRVLTVRCFFSCRARRYGISRWPHRKIKSLDKTIANLEATKTKNPAQQQKIQEELETARIAKEQLIHNPSATAPPKAIKARRRERMSFRGIDVSDDDSFESEELSSASETYHGTRRYSRSSSVSTESSPRGQVTPRNRSASISAVPAAPAPHPTPRTAPHARPAASSHGRAYSIPAPTKVTQPSPPTTRVPRISGLAKLRDAATEYSQSPMPAPPSAFTSTQRSGLPSGMLPGGYLMAPQVGIQNGASNGTPYFHGALPMGFHYGWPQPHAKGVMPPHVAYGVPISAQQQQQQAQSKEQGNSMEGQSSGTVSAPTSANGAAAPSAQHQSTSQSQALPVPPTKSGQTAPYMVPVHASYYPYLGSYFPMMQHGVLDQSRPMPAHPSYYFWGQQHTIQQHPLQQPQQSGKVTAFGQGPTQLHPQSAAAPSAPTHLSAFVPGGMESLLKLAETAELGGETQTAGASPSSAMDVSADAMPSSTSVQDTASTTTHDTGTEPGLPSHNVVTLVGGESHSHATSAPSSSQGAGPVAAASNFASTIRTLQPAPSRPESMVVS